MSLVTFGLGKNSGGGGSVDPLAVSSLDEVVLKLNEESTMILELNNESTLTIDLCECD